MGLNNRFRPRVEQLESRLTPAPLSGASFYDGHSYFAILGNVSWHEGEQQARQIGCHLVSINTPGENEFVVQLIRSAYGSDVLAWIGLTDEAAEGHFVWSNGEPVSYTNWAPGEPNNYPNSTNGEDHAVINWGLRQWNDATGTDRFGAVIECSAATPSPSGVTIYAHDANGRLFTLDARTGAVNVIGFMAAVMTDIAFAPDGTLYGVDLGSSLYRINPNTGTSTRIGNVGAVVNALVSSSTGTLYAAGCGLYSLDVATGQGTLVGSFSGYCSGGDLAFDGSGALYMSTNTDQLVRVNPGTGSASLIGSIGFSGVFGLAYGSDGVLYGLSDWTQQIFSIDPRTGVGALIANFGGQGTFGAYGAAFLGEAARLTLSITDVTVNEGGSAIFEVRLSASSSQTVTVQFDTADGTAVASNQSGAGDYQNVTGTLTFAPGETVKTITVHVNGDALDESNETFSVTLSSPTNAVIADGRGEGTIIDNYVQQRMFIFSFVGYSGAEPGSGVAEFRDKILLNAQIANELLVVDAGVFEWRELLPGTQFRAARDRVIQVLTEEQAKPTDIVVFIGHSHGGHIAYKLASDPSVITAGGGDGADYLITFDPVSWAAAHVRDHGLRQTGLTLSKPAGVVVTNYVQVRDPRIRGYKIAGATNVSLSCGPDRVRNTRDDATHQSIDNDLSPGRDGTFGTSDDATLGIHQDALERLRSFLL